MCTIRGEWVLSGHAPLVPSALLSLWGLKQPEEDKRGCHKSTELKARVTAVEVYKGLGFIIHSFILSAEENVPTLVLMTHSY